MARKIAGTILVLLFIFSIGCAIVSVGMLIPMKDISVGEQTDQADQLLVEATELLKEYFGEIEVDEGIQISIKKMPFGVDAATVYTDGDSGWATIFISKKVPKKDHGTQLYLVLHELTHAISRDSKFKEKFSEGMAERIAMDICNKNNIKYKTAIIAPYGNESKTVQKIFEKYGIEFYLKYLERDWQYFEELNDESVKKHFV